MTRREKLAALDELQRNLDQELLGMATDLNAFFAARSIPYKVEIDGRLVITDYRLDPRLPDV